MNSGRNYKMEMPSWKAVTEKGGGVIKSNQMKIISYCDALHKRVNMILECISRIISKTNTRLILFQSMALGKLLGKYCV